MALFLALFIWLARRCGYSEQYTARSNRVDKGRLTPIRATARMSIARYHLMIRQGCDQVWHILDQKTQVVDALAIFPQDVTQGMIFGERLDKLQMAISKIKVGQELHSFSALPLERESCQWQRSLQAT